MLRRHEEVFVKLIKVRLKCRGYAKWLLSLVSKLILYYLLGYIS